MIIFKKRKPLWFKRSGSFEMMNEFNDTVFKKPKQKPSTLVYACKSGPRRPRQEDSGTLLVIWLTLGSMRDFISKNKVENNRKKLMWISSLPCVYMGMCALAWVHCT